MNKRKLLYIMILLAIMPSCIIKNRFVKKQPTIVDKAEEKVALIDAKVSELEKQQKIAEKTRKRLSKLVIKRDSMIKIQDGILAQMEDVKIQNILAAQEIKRLKEKWLPTNEPEQRISTFNKKLIQLEAKEKGIRKSIEKYNKEIETKNIELNRYDTITEDINNAKLELTQAKKELDLAQGSLDAPNANSLAAITDGLNLSFGTQEENIPAMPEESYPEAAEDIEETTELQDETIDSLSKGKPASEEELPASVIAASSVEISAAGAGISEAGAEAPAPETDTAIGIGSDTLSAVDGIPGAETEYTEHIDIQESLEDMPLISREGEKIAGEENTTSEETLSEIEHVETQIELANIPQKTDFNKPINKYEPPEPVIKKKKVVYHKRYARTYKVQKGDLLPGIAQKVYGDSRKWKAIYKANRNQISRGLVEKGQVLIIP